MVSEVPRCQTVKTAVHHDAQLIGDSLWHVQPMELIVQECRQAAVELPCMKRTELLTDGYFSRYSKCVRCRCRLLIPIFVSVCLSVSHAASLGFDVHKRLNGLRYFLG